MSDLPEHVRKNRAKRDDLAKEFAAAGERGWARDTPIDAAHLAVQVVGKQVQLCFWDVPYIPNIESNGPTIRESSFTCRMVNGFDFSRTPALTSRI